MPYTAETRPETAKTKRLLETMEMKVLRGWKDSSGQEN